MATAGHFVTMLGVLSFYFMLLDSHIEKKVYIYLHTLVPRFNKRVLYYLGKLINYKQNSKLYALVPNADTQRLLLKYNHNSTYNSLHYRNSF